MGYRVHAFSPDEDTPTGQVADVEVSASYDDLDALRAFATQRRRGDVRVRERAQSRRSKRVGSAVAGAAVAVLRCTSAQQRAREKTFLADRGLPTVPFDAGRHARRAVGRRCGRVGTPAVSRRRPSATTARARRRSSRTGRRRVASGRPSGTRRRSSRSVHRACRRSSRSWRRADSTARLRSIRSFENRASRPHPRCDHRPGRRARRPPSPGPRRSRRTHPRGAALRRGAVRRVLPQHRTASCWSTSWRRGRTTPAT